MDGVTANLGTHTLTVFKKKKRSNSMNSNDFTIRQNHSHNTMSLFYMDIRHGRLAFSKGLNGKSSDVMWNKCDGARSQGDCLYHWIIFSHVQRCGSGDGNVISLALLAPDAKILYRILHWSFGILLTHSQVWRPNTWKLCLIVSKIYNIPQFIDPKSEFSK